MSEDWTIYRIGDLGEIITGRTPPTKNPEYFGSKYPFITPSDMDGRKRASSTERYLSDSGAELLRRNLLPPESVAVSCIGWQMGKSIMTSIPSFTNQQLNSIIPNKEFVDPEFLYYSLVTRREELLSLGSATGVRTPILNKSAFSDLEIVLPPLETQRKIAAVLSAYDDLIENNTRRIQILEEMAQAIYRQWFVEFKYPVHEGVPLIDSGTELGEIPQGWEAGRLDEALILQRGFDLPKRDRKEGNIPIYASTGVTGTHNEAKAKAPGIVTGRSGSLGTVIYVEDDYWPLNTTLWVKEFRSVTPIYAYYLLKDLDFSQFNSGAAVPTLNRNDVHGLPVIIPPPDILASFNSFILPLYELRRNLIAKNANLRATRDLLLPRLVSGEIDPKGLEDLSGLGVE